MEKKQLYTAPAVREFAVRYEGSFMTSYNGGSIDNGGEEDDWGDLN